MSVENRAGKFLGNLRTTSLAILGGISQEINFLIRYPVFDQRYRQEVGQLSPEELLGEQERLDKSRNKWEIVSGSLVYGTAIIGFATGIALSEVKPDAFTIWSLSVSAGSLVGLEFHCIWRIVKAKGNIIQRVLYQGN